MDNLIEIYSGFSDFGKKILPWFIPLIFMVVFYKLFWVKHKNNQDFLQTQRQTLLKTEKKLAIEAKTNVLREDETKKLEQKLLELDEVLPTTDERSALYEEINNSANKHGVKIFIKGKPNNSGTKNIINGNLLALPFDLGLEGPFHSMMMVIDELNVMKRIITIEKLNIQQNRRNKNDSNNFLRADLSLNTYRYASEVANTKGNK